MAKLYVDGIEDIQKTLQATEEGIADFVDDVLTSGGDIAKKKVELSIMRHNHFKTGVLLRSIKLKKAKDKDGRRYVDVVAAGTRDSGATNAQVAFTLNYGRSNFRGTRFWTEAEEQARKEYEELLKQKTKLYLKEKGIN